MPNTTNQKSVKSGVILEKYDTTAQGIVILRTTDEMRPKSDALKKPARFKPYPKAMMRTKAATRVNTASIPRVQKKNGASIVRRSPPQHVVSLRKTPQRPFTSYFRGASAALSASKSGANVMSFRRSSCAKPIFTM